MRKQVEKPVREGIPGRLPSAFIDLEAIARVEISSESADFPVERALIPSDSGGGWRAGAPGEQTLRLLFDAPQTIRTIEVVFDAEGSSRTQQFVLRWSGDRGSTYREIVRQQYNFSPPHTTHEEEHYNVNLTSVDALELVITPDISGEPALASLTALRLS